MDLLLHLISVHVRRHLQAFGPLCIRLREELFKDGMAPPLRDAPWPDFIRDVCTLEQKAQDELSVLWIFQCLFGALVLQDLLHALQLFAVLCQVGCKDHGDHEAPHLFDLFQWHICKDVGMLIEKDPLGAGCMMAFQRRKVIVPHSKGSNCLRVVSWLLLLEMYEMMVEERDLHSTMQQMKMKNAAAFGGGGS